MKIGDKYERLTVLAAAASDGHSHRRWVFLCECGKQKTIAENSVRVGATRSCGCLRKEMVRDRMTTHGQAPRTGMSKTYKIWAGMISRCETPSATGYERYGGIGIRVCERWHSFENFFADMGECPANHSIDRKKGAEGYRPGNCRWATDQEQNENRKSVRIYQFNGESLNLTQWAQKLGISKATMYQRIDKWPLDRALTERKSK